MLWILLIRNANTNTNTKSFYHNSIAHPENKTCRVDIVTSRNRDYRPYAISELSFLYIYYWKYTEWNEVHTVNPGSISSRFFLSPLNVRGFFFFGTEELCWILFLPICTSRIYSVHVYITPLPPATEMVRPTNRGISHVSYFLCHATCAPRSSHWWYFRSNARSLYKEFCHLCRVNAKSKWPLLKIQAQWAMRFSDISGHRSIRICIVLTVFV